MTTNLTSQTAPVTDEELDQMIWKLERDGGMTPKMLSLMRELREVRRAKSEPVAWRWFHLNQWHVTNDEDRARDLAWDGVKVMPLYTSPPALVVPDEMAISDDMNLYQKSFAQGHNACRATMINNS